MMAGWIDSGLRARPLAGAVEQAAQKISVVLELCGDRRCRCFDGYQYQALLVQAMRGGG